MGNISIETIILDDEIDPHARGNEERADRDRFMRNWAVEDVRIDTETDAEDLPKDFPLSEADRAQWDKGGKLHQGEKWQIPTTRIEHIHEASNVIEVQPPEVETEIVDLTEINLIEEQAGQGEDTEKDSQDHDTSRTENTENDEVKLATPRLLEKPILNDGEDLEGLMKIYSQDGEPDQSGEPKGRKHRFWSRLFGRRQRQVAPVSLYLPAPTQTDPSIDPVDDRSALSKLDYVSYFSMDHYKMDNVKVVCIQSWEGTKRRHLNIHKGQVIKQTIASDASGMAYGYCKRRVLKRKVFGYCPAANVRFQT